MRLPGRVSRPIRLFLLGLLCGLSAICALYVTQNALGYVLPRLFDRHSGLSRSVRGVEVAEAEPVKRLLLVGIMTAAKYVDSRAYNVWRTWSQHVPGKVLFFVAENTVSQYPDLPLVRLKGVDDTYPPQKKSFAMMRWMFDNHLNDFDWFMRADDDLYVRGERLESFLRSLDPGKVHLIGQAGLGNSAEYGQLSLGPQDNYCMGGPGVVVSQKTLEVVAPHLESCLLNLMTTHEDVELGRCIRKHAGVACTWNYQMQELFHNNQSQPNVYAAGGASELRHAITLHPVKDPAVMLQLHVEAETLKLNELRSEQTRLKREFANQQPSLTRRIANTTTDLQVWEFLAANKLTFCANQVVCPRHTIDSNMRAAIGSIVTQLFDDFNKNARQRGRLLQFQNIQYGYARVEPRHGVDYVVDLILLFKKFRPPHRATLSVRRHAYIQQTFAAPEAITERQHRRLMHRRAAFENANVSDLAFHDDDHVLRKTIHILMPLKGRAQTFERFATNLRQILPSDETHIELIVICYDSDPTEDEAIRKTIAELSAIMPARAVEMHGEEFSRGRALAAGAATLPAGALMFFTDVDMIFTYETLQRIRLNTIEGAQVYFPIVFSEFSARFWNAADRQEDPNHSHFAYGRQRGYFRHFGYGLVSIFRRDFDEIGGFNLTIQGWGMEDVDLFEKCVASKHLRVFRSPEPSLVHVFHEIKCPTQISPSQQHMCIGSKAASMASLDSLAETFSLYA
ncbi:Hexosyltransferase [Aphelenchoides fujianensis]|nr:Hexosyltransferase [Aphelenchoides fujianensis]